MEPSLPLVRTTIYILDICNYHCSSPPSSTVPSATMVGVAIWTLPGELTPEWDKGPLGDQIVTDVASLLQSGDGWQCRSHIYLSDLLR